MACDECASQIWCRPPHSWHGNVEGLTYTNHESWVGPEPIRPYTRPATLYGEFPMSTASQMLSLLKPIKKSGKSENAVTDTAKPRRLAER